MPSCEYMVWSHAAKDLVRCGEEAVAGKVLIKRKAHCLCAAHKEFAQDAVSNYEVQLYKLKEKQRKDRIRGQIK